MYLQKLQLTNFRNYENLELEFSKGVNVFAIIEESKTGVQVGKVFSEIQLIDLPKEYDQTIADKLLSHDRLKRKIDHFNGYVGYVGDNHSIYAGRKFEKGRLNVIR